MKRVAGKVVSTSTARNAPRGKATFRKSSPATIALFENAIQHFPRARVRKMFGYPCAFVKGRMTTGIYEEKFFIRLPPERQQNLLGLPGARHFEPMPGRPMKNYVVLPAEVTGSARRLRGWLSTSINEAMQLLVKRKGPTKGSTRRRST